MKLNDLKNMLQRITRGISPHGLLDLRYCEPDIKLPDNNLSLKARVAINNLVTVKTGTYKGCTGYRFTVLDTVTGGYIQAVQIYAIETNQFGEKVINTVLIDENGEVLL